MAALNVHTGEVSPATPSATTPTTSSASWTNRAATPTELAVHLVLDNGASHIAKRPRPGSPTIPASSSTTPPKHASWLNQVELFFSILTRKLLRHGEFASRDELVTAIMRFITEHNRTARPFGWTYDGTPLKVA